MINKIFVVELWNFNKVLRLDFIPNQSFLFKLKTLVNVLIYLIILIYLISFFKYLLDLYGLPYKLNTKFDSFEGNKGFLILLIGFYQPIYEELAFRWSLIFSERRAFVSFFLISTLLIKIVFLKFLILKIDSYYLYFCVEFLFLIFGYIIIKLILFFIFKFLQINFFNLIKLHGFFLVVLWTLFHFNNYYLSYDEIYVFIITFFFFLMFGVLLSYIRIKNGIGWSIFLHILYNLTLLF